MPVWRTNNRSANQFELIFLNIVAQPGLNTVGCTKNYIVTKQNPDQVVYDEL